MTKLMTCGHILTSIKFDLAIDLAHKDQTCLVTNGSREDEKHKSNDEIVSKVEEHAEGLGDIQLGIVVENGIQKHMNGTRARGEEGPPPPLIIAMAKIYVAQHNAHFGASDGQDHEDKQHETKDVVIVPKPD